MKKLVLTFALLITSVFGVAAQLNFFGISLRVSKESFKEALRRKGFKDGEEGDFFWGYSRFMGGYIFDESAKVFVSDPGDLGTIKGTCLVEFSIRRFNHEIAEKAEFISNKLVGKYKKTPGVIITYGSALKYLKGCKPSEGKKYVDLYDVLESTPEGNLIYKDIPYVKIKFRNGDYIEMKVKPNTGSLYKKDLEWLISLQYVDKTMFDSYVNKAKKKGRLE